MSAASLPLSLSPIFVSADALSTLAPVQQQIEGLQVEVDALRQEVELLRKRDETVNFYIQRLDDEMRLAARLQRDFLPKSLPQLGQVHFHTLFRPAGYVSGDLYDVMRLDEEHVGFYMADAVGHGMPAALLTMFIKNALVTKEIAPDGYRLLAPGQTMARLNETLVSQKLSYATFATALYGYVNTASGEVTFARGGHPNPVLIRADGSVESPHADGSLLGIFDGEQYSDRTINLNAGDRLFLFTDGVEVVFGGEQPLDAEQWRHELHRRRQMTVEAMLDDFSQQLDRAAGSLEPKDDLTIIVIERK